MTYKINKRKKTINQNKSLEVTKISGYNFVPKVDLPDLDISIDHLQVVDHKAINSILKRKARIYLEDYVKYLKYLEDNSDPNDGSNIRQAIDQLERYKSLIKHKYRSFLDEKTFKLLISKINILQSNFLAKIYYIRDDTLDNNLTHRR